MRSIFSKLLIWFVLTLVVSFAAFLVTSAYLAARSADPGGLMTSAVLLQLEGAVSAYESGGKTALSGYLRRLDELFPARHALLDGVGRDMLTGQDRSEELARAGVRPKRPPPPGAPILIERATPDGRYRILVAALPRFDPLAYLPYYGWIVLLIALMCYGFARYLATPLRQLRQSVGRFGGGDLSHRVRSSRKDELGDLAREFDCMADRIETLLSAERRLLQDISHELRSPLSRLVFAVELARTSDDREPAFARIKKEVSRLSGLVGELLEMTRAESDPSTRSLEQFDVAELAKAVADDCALEAQQKGCRIECQCDQGLDFWGDRELLRRAVENVLRNAIRYSPEGSVVSAAVFNTGGWRIIRIRDHGPGVPEGMLEQIFQPFFRVDSDRSRDSGGTGLGLSIAERAVRLHLGEIKARNAAPGLEVEIRLPVTTEIGTCM